jgi:glutamine amidotransferase
MGWNQLSVNKQSALLDNLREENYAYFVHSYYCAPDNPDDILAVVDYGIEFTAIVQRDNIYGVQFHPEKSQATGLRILSNFLKL